MPDLNPSLSVPARDYLKEHGFYCPDEIGEGDWIGCDPPIDMPQEESDKHYKEAATLAGEEQ